MSGKPSRASGLEISKIKYQKSNKRKKTSKNPSYLIFDITKDQFHMWDFSAPL